MTAEINPDAAMELLRESEQAHLAARAAARSASNARIRAVNDAKDAGLSYRQMAAVMTAVHPTGTPPVRPGDLPKLLACGYPEEEATEAL
jgi:hypothetical protein